MSNFPNTSSETPISNTIYINPRFRNAHINPNFLPRKPPTQTTQPFNIHINPLFLSAHQMSTTVPRVASHPPTTHPPKASIISQTNRKLVRQPLVGTSSVSVRLHNEPKKEPPQLVKIGNRKLVRVKVPPSRPPLGILSNLGQKVRTPVKVLNKKAYSIDRRNRLNLPNKRNLYRISNQLNESLESTRVVVTDRRLLRM